MFTVKTIESYQTADGQIFSTYAEAEAHNAKIAAQYNEYILKNNYVWKYGIPDDIKETLDYIK